VEISENIQSLDQVKSIETLRVQIAQQIATALDVDAKVILVEPRSLRQLAGGAERVVDRRP